MRVQWIDRLDARGYFYGRHGDGSDDLCVCDAYDSALP